MSYVCAYSSVKLDKSRIEKEFTLRRTDAYIEFMKIRVMDRLEQRFLRTVVPAL